MASSVAFAAARGRGGAPADLTGVAAAADTLVVLMALEGLAVTVAAIAGVVGASRPAAVIAAAGTRRQRVVRGQVGTIAALCEEAALEPPLVVGEVVTAAGSAGLAAAAAPAGEGWSCGRAPAARRSPAASTRACAGSGQVRPGLVGLPRTGHHILTPASLRHSTS